MADETKTRRSRVRLWIELTLGVVLLAIIVGLAWYVRNPRFKDFVRRKVIAALEDATGGRVDLGSFRWNLSQLEFEADDLTVHGREGPEELPYAHADQVHARLHIVSFLSARVSLEYLGLEHPVVHILVYPDGTTNAPEPRTKTATAPPVQRLFDLAISRADLRNGLLLLNDRRIPFDFSANDLDVAMTFHRSDHRYDGTLQVGKVDAKYQDFRDVAARAEIEFRLWPNTAQITSLKINSEKSSLEAQGKVTGFNDPQIEFTYNALLDLGQLGAITRTYELRSGTLAARGSGRYSATSQSSKGWVALRGFNYLQEGVTLRNTNATADFSIEDGRLTLTRIAGRLLGGQVTGEATIENFFTSSSANPEASSANSRPRREPAKKSGKSERPAATTAKISGPGPQRGTARLHVGGASLAELVGAISTKSLPFAALKPVGSVTGGIDLTWVGSLANAQGELALDIAAPQQSSAAELPVSGNLRSHFSLHPQLMKIAAFNLTTPHTHLNASGILGATSENLKIDFTANSLKEFEPFVVALGYAPSPVELAGQASFSGTVSGKLSDSQIAGHVQASDFTYTYTLMSKSPTPPPQPPAKRKSSVHMASAASPEPSPAAQVRHLHIDQFSADVQYSLSKVAVLHAVIQEGSAHLNVDWTAALEKGNFTDSSPFQLQAAVHNADVTDLQRAVGLDYPVHGTLNATMEAGGTEGNPRGQGQFSLTGAEAYGRPIKSASANLSFANHDAEFTHIRLLAAHGVIAGSAGYDFSTKDVRFDLNGAGIDLAEIPELQRARLQTAGQVSFAAKGSGTSDEPVINGSLQVTDLVLNGERTGGLTANVVTRGQQLQLTARSNFPRASLSLDGKVDLRGDMPGDFTMQFSNLDIDPFLRQELRGRITGHSSMAGQATVTGPLKQPQLLSGDLMINQFKVEVEKVAIASDGPIKLRLSKGVVSIERFALVSEDSHLTINGNAGLQDNHQLDLRADGSIDLKVVHTLDPDVTSYGQVTMGLAITGDTTKPLMNGRIEIVHGGLSMIDLPAGLGDINGTFIFNQNRLEVEHLTAHTGGGLLNFSGFVTYGRTVGFDLTATGNDIRFRYAGISVTSDQSLHLVGTLQNSTLSGDVTVTRFAQIPSTDLKFALAQASPSVVPNPRSPLNGLRLDVRILSAPELTVQTSLAKLSGGVDLRLRGTAARPVLLGRINIAEGDLKIGGTKYHLERGDITFIDPIRIDPVLDVEATTRVRDYDITIGLHGTLERLTTTYRSDPPLTTEDIVGLLAFGRTQYDTTTAATPQFGFAETASNAVLGEAINQTVSNRMQRLFGVSSIRIAPSVGGADNNPNARLTVEQQVSSNVTLTYITNLTRSAQQVIQFEYNINAEYTLQGIRDENGVVSFDLLIRKRKR